MGKRAAILAAVGFPLGVLVDLVLSLSGEGPVLCSPILVDRMSGNVSAAIACSILLCGLYGSACMAGTVFYDIERWPLLLGTVLHYLTIALGGLVCFLVLGWGGGIRDWLILVAIQSVIFVCIWITVYLKFKAQVKELNELNRNKRDPS